MRGHGVGPDGRWGRETLEDLGTPEGGWLAVLHLKLLPLVLVWVSMRTGCQESTWEGRGSQE